MTTHFRSGIPITQPSASETLPKLVLTPGQRSKLAILLGIALLMRDAPYPPTTPSRPANLTKELIEAHLG
jgi:hypothetical protein